MVVGGARDNHAAGLGELLEPGGDVDAVPVQIPVLLSDHIAEVDAYTEVDALFLGCLHLALRHATLDRHSAHRGVDDGGKLA